MKINQYCRNALTRPITILFLASVLALFLATCAGGTALDESDQNEGKTRPGILSGSTGEFVIFSN